VSEHLPLGLDELLTTTRAVRRRLDFSRPIDRKVIDECLEIAVQAPTPSNLQNWHFVVVTELEKKKALADLYRRGRELYLSLPSAEPGMTYREWAVSTPARQKVEQSALYLNKHFEEAPVLFIPCVTGRTDSPANPKDTVPSVLIQSAQWGSIAPAAWNFMLAARARGLGTCWTSLHLYFEREAAEIIGIPYDEVMQISLIPVAYTLGVDFKAAPRAPMTEIVHWDTW
jgi:nitroreductase